MKKTLLTLLAAATIMPMSAETISLNGKNHEIEELISREVGPGITYKRLRSSTYPLNVNMLIMDVTNPYNRIETTTANNSAAGTESLVKAAQRQSVNGKKAIAGANANFWCVATQEPNYPLLSGSCFGGHGQNGKMITETNNWNNKWSGGWKHTGIVGIDANRLLHVGHHYYAGYVNHAAIGERQLGIHQINKLAAPGEVCLYNSFYGTSKQFRPVKLDTNPATNKTEYMVTYDNDCTEILLDFAPDNTWAIGAPMKMIVKEVRLNAGNGTLGSHDAALVGKGDAGTILSVIGVGDEVTLETNYYDANKNLVPLENFICGNATVMIDGELTNYNTTDNYCAQVYSRTCYGSSADGKTLYIIVIDKATDPVYGQSVGCPTRVPCEIARHYGCANMVNFDAGGSAEMLLNGAIINRTTESAPRAVSNGWLLYSIAPEDNEVARLEFDDITLVAPPYSTFVPRIIAYNQYGDVIDYDFKDFTLSCDPALGSCEGSTFIAGGSPMTMPLTAHYGEVSVSKDLTIANADMSLRIKNLLIDGTREYPIEVTATIGSNTYVYDASTIEWTIADEGIIDISNGTLKGLREGSTEIIGRIGDFEDSGKVTVEIAPEATLNLTDWADWRLAGVGVTSPTISEDGTISFTYGINSRTGSNLTATKTATYYSLPDRLWFEFTSSVPVEKLTLDVRTPLDARPNTVDLTNGEANYQAGEKYRLELPLTQVCDDPQDLINYPLALNSIKFTFAKEDALKGSAQTVIIHSIQAEYDHTSGVEQVAAENTGMPSATRYYDITGRRITRPVPGQFYIMHRNGRATKHIAR